MTRGRPFEPGNKLSRGRPRGSRNKLQARGQHLLDEHQEAIVRTSLVKALKGDIPLLRILLSYILRHPDERPVRIGALPMLSKTSEKILARVALGKLSLGQAQSLNTLIESRRRILETQDFETRLRTLEKTSENDDSE